MRIDADQDCLVPPASVATASPVAAPRGVTEAQEAPAAIERFLGAIGARAFRFAELGLRQRDDALDAVQDAMMRMLCSDGAGTGVCPGRSARRG